MGTQKGSGIDVFLESAPSFTMRTYSEILEFDIEVSQLEECGVMLINCPWLHLALKPEPPGGAPQGYSQVSAH